MAVAVQGAAVAVDGDCLYIQGGRNNFVCDDVWVVSMSSLVWTEIKTSGRTPPPRHSHIITVTKDTMYIYGGTDELGGQRCVCTRHHCAYGGCQGVGGRRAPLLWMSPIPKAFIRRCCLHAWMPLLGGNYR